MLLVLILSAAGFFLLRWAWQIHTNRRKGQNWLRSLFVNKVTFWVFTVLQTFVVLTLVRSVFTHAYENVMLCVLSLVLFLAPVFLERWLQVQLPTVLEIIILFFIYAAEILGEINSYYVRIPGWDTMLHTINGFLCAAIGFALVDLLNRNERFSVSLSPGYQALMAFCFSMTIGVLWEFIEFSCDSLSLIDMQKDFLVTQFASVNLDPTAGNDAVQVRDIVRTIIETADGSTIVIDGGYLDIGIIDTMKDLFVNFIGAIVFCAIGFLYVKHQGERGGFARQFIPVVLRRDKTSHESQHAADKG